MVVLERVKREKGEMARIRTLFRSAFPPEERPPFFFLKRRAGENVDWWNIVRDGTWAGFFYAVREGAFVYVFFFAIDPSMRGKGCGTEAMARLLEQYKGKSVFLAIEPVDPAAENYEERVRRFHFYQRCGLSPLGKSVKEGSVVYDLLGAGGNGENREGEAYRTMMDHWLGWPLKHLFPIRVLP